MRRSESLPLDPRATILGTRNHVRLRAWLEDARALLDRGHLAPLAVLTVLDVFVLRNLLFSRGLPAGIDSSFVYSLLPFFDSHGIQAFTGWLSAPLGQEQHYSIYWLLAFVNSVVGNSVAIYKGAVLVTMLVATAGSYGLAVWLSKSRLAAAVASGLYVLAPFSVAAWLAGHLDVTISYAVGPIALWAFWIAMRTGSRRAMAALGFAGSALYLLTTGQGAYWLLPLFVVGAAEAMRARQARTDWRSVARRFSSVIALSFCVFIAASAVQLLPFLVGVRAPFTQGNTHYYIEQLSTHAKYSLPLFDNVLGVPREVWMAPGVTITGSSFTALPFRLVAFLILAMALAAPFTRRMRNAGIALVLIVPTIFAWLLASGPEGPIRPLYLFLYHHVPYFTLLRAPNRWLMVSTLGLCMLIALTIGGLRGGRKTKTWFGNERDPGTRIALWATFLGLFLASYAVFHGLPTWKPPADYVQAYSSLRSDRSDWRIVTTPFYQTWMESGPKYGSDVALAADLGLTSTLWHGHSTLGRGGWDPRASRFAEYVSELTSQGTSRSLTKLLGAVGVKYIGVNPHHAIEVPGWQNAFFRRQTGLIPAAHQGDVTIFRNNYALPQAFLTPQSCIVAGGLHVLGDLSEQPSFSFGRTGLQYADQIAATGGRGALTRELAASRCLIIAPGGEHELTALLYASQTRDVRDMAPGSWTRSETAPSLDVTAEPSVSVSVPPTKTVAGSLKVPKAGTYSLWVAGLHAVEQPAVQVQIDGKNAGLIDLRSDVGSGVRWSPSDPTTLTPGSHRIELTNVSSGGGNDMLLTKVAFVDTSATLQPVFQAPGLRVIRESGGTGPETLSRSDFGPSLLGSAWRTDLSSGYVNALPQGNRLDFDVIRSGRPYYTLARAAATGKIDPYRPLAIRFRGTGSGQAVYLNAVFDERGDRIARFRFTDSSSAPRTIFFSPLQPTGASTIPDWSSVKGFTISTNSKARWHGAASIEGPYEITRSGGKPHFGEANHSTDPFAAAPPGANALGPTDQTINDHVTLRQGLDKGMLNFTQAYEPSWKLNSGETHASHTVSLGFANAYQLDSPLAKGSLNFTAAKYGRIGTWISFFTWLLGLTALLRFVRRNPRIVGPPSRSRRQVNFVNDFPSKDNDTRTSVRPEAPVVAPAGPPMGFARVRPRYEIGRLLKRLIEGIPVPPVRQPASRSKSFRLFVATCAAILIAGALITASHHSPNSVPISADGPTFWSNLDPSNVFVDEVRGPQNEHALQVDLHPGRRYFTIFEHSFKPTVDLSKRPYLLINFNGTGSGRAYDFRIDFKPDGSSFASYQIRDSRPGWRQVSLSTATPQGSKGDLDWSRVSGFSLATADKKAARFGIGVIQAANQISFGN